MIAKSKNKNANKYGKPITDYAEIPVIFDIAFAVRLLRQDYYVIVKKCQRGEIPAFKIGREWRFRKTDIEEYINAQINERYKPINYSDIANGKEMST